ncbi:hypothetical protein ACCUM_4602 [Candidatus Accumulibacter phosphatis]|uniref:Uncharacterized protein n=1 Tax=Candidatus Accumulibacter phosphatis TaxID=327160 RepID=A0A5S4ELL4_9PROT|nr:hypothetical protein ACCUM_4602 [Candidatus Accumulibacter phosphatis]
MMVQCNKKLFLGTGIDHAGAEQGQNRELIARRAPSSLSDLEPGKPTNFTFRHEKGRNLSIFRPF